MQTLISRRKTLGRKTLGRKTLGGLSAMLFVGSAVVTSSTRPAWAHEAPCPYCTMTITPDTAKQDNETVLKAGRKRIEYKCVYCALADAKTEYQGDVTIFAPSEKKGAPVIIKRVGGVWSVPANTTFVSTSRIKHKVCHVQARAFIKPAAAQAFAKKIGGQVLTLPQLVAQAK